MNTTVPEKPRFLVEWYRPDVGGEAAFDRSVARLIECAASTSAAGVPVNVLVVFAVQSDEVAFAIFDADSAAVVAEVCDRAGISAMRLTPAIGVQFPSSG